MLAQAPREGEVKTRLVPPLSAAEAAELSGCFIRDGADNILAAARIAAIDAYVAYSPPGSAAVFAALLPAAVRLLESRRIGLGKSLYDAAADLLAAGYGAVCLINSDSPNLPTALLAQAAAELTRAGDRIVLGPAADGGYYLIGLKQPHRRLFENIAWSTPQVLQQTIERAAELGLETLTLPVWYDVDDLASLRQLIGDLERADPGAYPAPHTAAMLRRLAGRL